MSRPMIEERTLSDIRARPPLTAAGTSGAAYSCRSEADRSTSRSTVGLWWRVSLEVVTVSQQSGAQRQIGEPERDLAGGALVAVAMAWTRFSVVMVAKSPRIVPGSASSTLVAPTSLRTSEKVLSAGPSTTIANTGDRVRKATSSPKNGLSACSA